MYFYELMSLEALSADNYVFKLMRDNKLVEFPFDYGYSEVHKGRDIVKQCVEFQIAELEDVAAFHLTKCVLDFDDAVHQGVSYGDKSGLRPTAILPIEETIDDDREVYGYTVRLQDKDGIIDTIAIVECGDFPEMKFPKKVFTRLTWNNTHYYSYLNHLVQVSVFEPHPKDWELAEAILLFDQARETRIAPEVFEKINEDHRVKMAEKYKNLPSE